MATKRTLVNKRTGKEHKVDNADAVLKKYKGVFKEKPSAEISESVAKKEQQITAKDNETVETKKENGTNTKDSKKQ